MQAQMQLPDNLFLHHNQVLWWNKAVFS